MNKPMSKFIIAIIILIVLGSAIAYYLIQVNNPFSSKNAASQNIIITPTISPTSTPLPTPTPLEVSDESIDGDMTALERDIMQLNTSQSNWSADLGNL